MAPVLCCRLALGAGLPCARRPGSLMEASPPSILTRGKGGAIAYRRQAGRSPGVVFLPGFRSDMNGAKALALERSCRKADRAYVRFDYTGHGSSAGDFVEGTVGQWLEDALAVIDSFTAGMQVLVGSSMGGWLALRAALARPQRIAGIVGVAAAPDFAHRFLDRLDDEGRRALQTAGVVRVPSRYSEEPTPITARLIEESRRHELLHAPFALDCPLRLRARCRHEHREHHRCTGEELQ